MIRKYLDEATKLSRGHIAMRQKGESFPKAHSEAKNGLLH